MVLCRDPKAATANDLLEAFIWYCSSQFEKFGKLHGYYRSAILEIYNAIKWSSYNPSRITKEERNMFHPEDCTMLDGSKPSQNDFRIYLDFLEAAIEHHLRNQEAENDGLVKRHYVLEWRRATATNGRNEL